MSARIVAISVLSLAAGASAMAIQGLSFGPDTILGSGSGGPSTLLGPLPQPTPPPSELYIRGRLRSAGQTTRAPPDGNPGGVIVHPSAKIALVPSYDDAIRLWFWHSTDEKPEYCNNDCSIFDTPPPLGPPPVAAAPSRDCQDLVGWLASQRFYVFLQRADLPAANDAYLRLFTRGACSFGVRAAPAARIGDNGVCIGSGDIYDLVRDAIDRNVTSGSTSTSTSSAAPVPSPTGPGSRTNQDSADLERVGAEGECYCVNVGGSDSGRRDIRWAVYGA